MAPLIALLTDFGLQDSYVGVMKGVIHGICPDARLVDITHAIQPQNIRQAAFTLMNVYRFFPVDTIFLTIVDPGVGSKRRPIGIQAGSYSFIGPDNGVFSYALAELPTPVVAELSNVGMRETAVSATFHGRDVFAPAAARLASGIGLLEFGQQIKDIVQLPRLTLEIEDTVIRGEVMHIDHFGNVITSIGPFNWVTAEQLTMYARSGVPEPVQVHARSARVVVNGETINAVYRTYSDGSPGDTMAIISSDRYLEIAVSHGNAANRLHLMIGDRVELHFA